MKELIMKGFKIKFLLRFFAIIDVVVAERFELTTYKDGRQSAKTTFCKKEIDEAVKQGKL
jgi:hypothetical protein